MERLKKRITTLSQEMGKMPKSGGAIVQLGHLIEKEDGEMLWLLGVCVMRRKYCVLMGFLGSQNKAENCQEWKLEDKLHWLE